MKKLILTMAVASLALTGCDLIRATLGKPTSKDIERARLELEARQKAQRDSIAAARLAQDTIAALQTEESALHRYYVIAGSFLLPDNADKFSEKLRKMGYDVKTFNFKNGFKVVGICGTEDIRTASREMENMMELPFSPYDPWIYDTTAQLHE